MATLTTAQRKKMPQKDYALPGKRFPMEDKAHAVAAERLVGRAEKAGSITPAQAAEVKNKAAAKLGHKTDNAASGKLGKKPDHDGDMDVKTKAMHDKAHAHEGAMFHDSLMAMHHTGTSHTSKNN